MARELAYVLINPYSIRKSRTGGIIARYLSRTDLRLAGARMFGPSRELVEEYAELVRESEPKDCPSCALLPDYILREYAPDTVSGRPHRTMLLLFEGPDAVAKIKALTGSAHLRWGYGETIRETFGDYLTDAQGELRYFEPAVMVSPSRESACEALKLWARYSDSCGGIINSAFDMEGGSDVEQTLVVLKPDNFQRPSLRMGNIIDVLSSTGLRIVAVKKLSLTVAQAEKFYESVRDSLRRKFPLFGAERIAEITGRELGFEVPEAAARVFCEQISPLYAAYEFERIVEFITGYNPSNCTPEEKAYRTGADCFAIVYEGAKAIRKIRDALGETDPGKARPGSVRREFGTNIMVNAAHASDSVASARSEMEIIEIAEDNFAHLIEKYCNEQDT